VSAQASSPWCHGLEGIDRADTTVSRGPVDVATGGDVNQVAMERLMVVDGTH
jgi:hypothetical protein